MEITTTVRKAALMRLVTFSAPGNIDVRKALRKLREKVEAEGATAFAESDTELAAGGGFSSENPTHPVELGLGDAELRRLDAAFGQAQWDPRVIPEALEDVIWELSDEIKAWVEEAEAERVYNRLSDKQKAAIVKAEERVKKAKKEGNDD